MNSLSSKLVMLLNVSIFCLLFNSSVEADAAYLTCPAPDQLYKITNTNGVINGTFDTGHGWNTSADKSKLSNLPDNFISTIQFKSVSIVHAAISSSSYASVVQVNCDYIILTGNVLIVYQNINAKAYQDHWWISHDNTSYPDSFCGIHMEENGSVPVSYCKFTTS